MGCIGAVVVGILVLVALFALTGAEVGAGNVGVVSTWGAIDAKAQPLGPGFNMVLPFANHVTEVSTQVQAHQFSEVDTATSDQQQLRLWGVVNYHIQSGKAAEVTIEGGPDAVIAKVFDPVFQSGVKATVPKFDALTVQLHRSDMETETTSAFQQVAAQYGITVERVVIRDMQFSPDYTKAIEQKAVAQQQLQQAAIEAQTAKTKAEGQAQANIAVAQGDAQANKLRSDSLTDALNQYYAIQKWDGHLSQVSGSNGNLISLGGPKP